MHSNSRETNEGEIENLKKEIEEIKKEIETEIKAGKKEQVELYKALGQLEAEYKTINAVSIVQFKFYNRKIRLISRK